MNRAFILIIILFSIPKVSSSQLNIDSSSKRNLIGNCYAAILEQEDTIQRDTAYLVISPAIFKYDTIKILTRERFIYPKPDIQYDTTFFYRPPIDYQEWIPQGQDVKKECTPTLKSNDILLFYVNRYIPKITQPIIKIKSSYHLDSIQRDSTEIVIARKERNTQLKIYDNLEEAVAEKGLFIPIVKGKWSEFFLVPCNRPQSDELIYYIQCGLQRNGYPCQITGILDVQTKKAFIQFKKENTLHQIGEGIETMKKLGIPIR